MKVAIFSDIHFGLKTEASHWDEVIEKWGDWFISELKERDIKTIIFLGDFFHNRKTISVYTLHQTVDFLNKLKDFQVHMIIGNHDLFYLNDPNVSAVNIFNGFPNITVHRGLDTMNLGGRSCVFAGWGLDPLSVEGTHDVLFTHAEINTFCFNASNEACKDGIDGSALLKKYKVVYSGHFHINQQKIYPKGKIRYVGNPFQMDFSDSGNDKGFDVFDLETLKWESIINNETPIFKVITTSCFKAKQCGEILERMFVKLYVDEDIDLKDFEAIKTEIYAKNPKSLVTEWMPEKISEERGEYEIKAFDITDAINEYVEMLKLDNEEDVKNYLMDTYKIIRLEA